MEKVVPLDDHKLNLVRYCHFFRGCEKSSHGDEQMRGGDFQT